jgi:tRNA pseudouridine38-40 synthase
MQKGAQYLLGTHDFLALSEKSEQPDRNNIRTLYKVQIRSVRQEIWIDVIGSAFIKGMMRRISGALLEVGLGKQSAEYIKNLLDPTIRERLQWPQVLPAHGLTLMKISYGRHPKDFRQERN